MHHVMADANECKMNDLAVRFTTALGSTLSSRVVLDVENDYDFDDAQENEERYFEGEKACGGPMAGYEELCGMALGERFSWGITTQDRPCQCPFVRLLRWFAQ